MESNSQIYMLAGDFGGTNFRLTLLKYEQSHFEQLQSVHKKTEDTESIVKELKSFLNTLEIDTF